MASPAFVRPLARAEQKELARLVRAGPKPRVVRMSAQGHLVARIAEAWDVHPHTVRRTIQAFNADGPAALADKPRARSALGLAPGIMEVAAGLIVLPGSLWRVWPCRDVVRPAPVPRTRLPAAA